MATVGQILASPEAGWKRIDNTDPNIRFGGANWVYKSLTNNTWMKTHVETSSTSNVGHTISFSFFGSKFRVLSYLWTNRSPNMEVTVDGVVVGSYSQQGSLSWNDSVLVYELTGLTFGAHEVTITNKASGVYLDFDAIDIDASGYMVEPQATWSPTDKGTAVTLSNGNLTASYSTYQNSTARVSIGKASGKWYWEMRYDVQNTSSYSSIGVGKMSQAISTSVYPNFGGNGWVYRIGAGSGAGKTYGFALDMEAGTLQIYEENVLKTSLTGVNGVVAPIVGDDNSNASATITANFGKFPFKYAAPTGFSAYSRYSISRFLVVEGGISKSFINGAWVNVGSATPTEQQFIEQGMAALELVTEAAWGEISDSYDVIQYTDDMAYPAPTYKAEVNPFKPIFNLPTTVQVTQWTNTPETVLSNEYTDNIVPDMVTNVSPSGRITYSGTYSETDYPGWKAFDRNNIDYFCWYAPVPAWLAYEFPTQRAVCKYAITNRNYSNPENPLNWTFDGWDGNSWVTLHTVTGYSNWGINVKREFTFDNVSPFIKYRLNVTSASAAWVAIGELEMMEKADPNPKLTIEGLKKIGFRYKVEALGYASVDRVLSSTNSIPAMTSESTPSGIASASTVYSTGYLAWRAFDRADGDNSWATASTNAAGWLAYEFPSPKIIGSYSMVSRTPVANILEMPKDWTFEGWNESTGVWDILDSRTGVSWTQGIKQTFILNNTTLYKKYRINGTNGGVFASDYYLCIGNVEMFELVETLGAESLLSTLKDWTYTLDVVNESAVLDDSYITTVNPYNIRVTAVNDVTGYSDSKVARVTLYDTEPTLICTMTGMRLDVQVGDPETDLVKFKIVLNGTKIYPNIEGADFTELAQTPFNYSRVLRSNEVNVGGANTLTVTAVDQFGKQSVVTLNFTGEYAGLMFADELGTFYSDDLGNVLQYLDMGVLVAGQISETYPVRLINKTGFTITNIEMWKDRKTLPPSASVEISKTAVPFEPVDLMTFDSVLNYADEVTFYVRIVTQINGQPGQGDFDVYVKADPS